MVALRNYGKKKGCTIAGITVQQIPVGPRKWVGEPDQSTVAKLKSNWDLCYNENLILREKYSGPLAQAIDVGCGYVVHINC